MLYDGWNAEVAEKLKDIGLILSAGDLCPEYLEFLVTMLNVPLLYVRGNHDSRYDTEPPEGCDDVDDKVAEIIIGEDGTAQVCENIVQGIPGIRVPIKKKALMRRSSRLIRIAGLGGSISYDEAGDETYTPEDEFTENEMRSRVKKLKWILKDYSLADKVLSGEKSRQEMLSREQAGDDSSVPVSNDNRHSTLDILLTHSPAFGHGDMPDPSHTGFKCFNEILMYAKPAYHFYGHVHNEYGQVARECVHESGTREINVCGMYILEI